MTGFGHRLVLSPNEFERQRLFFESSGRKLLDLVGGNPTENGILFSPEPLADSFSDYLRSRHYSPNPQGLVEARRSIAGYYASRGIPELADESRIFITASTSEAYSLLFSLLCEPGDNVLVPSPSYPLFDMLADHARIQLRRYKLVFDEVKNLWEVDFRSLVDQVNKRSRALMFVSPHNPSGQILGCVSELDTLEKLGLPLVVDEVFSEFVFQGQEPENAGTQFLSEATVKLPVFVLNGISKMFALPDLKLGWIGLSERAASHWHSRLELLNDVFLSANSAIQHALPTIFAHGRAVTEEIFKRAQSNLEVVRSLTASASGLEPIYPQGGLMLIFRLPAGRDEEEVVFQLLEEGFIAHPGFFYDIECFPAVVFSLLTKPEWFNKGMAALQSICQHNKTRRDV